MSCVILSDSVILLIDYQWAQVAAELSTVFGLFLVGNRGLAVSYRILPLVSNKDSVSDEMPPRPFNTAQVVREDTFCSPQWKHNLGAKTF